MVKNSTKPFIIAKKKSGSSEHNDCNYSNAFNHLGSEWVFNLQPTIDEGGTWISASFLRDFGNP